MNNPFTNWLDVNIGATEYRDKLSEVTTFFENEAVLDSLFINNVNRYKIEGENFYLPSNELKLFDGRSIEPNSQLLKKILEPQNVIWNNDELNLDEPIISKRAYYDIIVSEDFFKKLELNNTNTYKVKSWFRDDVNIWLNVLAVVKQLPNNTDYLMFPNLMNALSDKDGFIETEEGKRLELLNNSSDTNTVYLQIESALGNIGTDINNNYTEIEEFKISDNKSLFLYRFFTNSVFFTPQEAQKKLIKGNILNDELQFYHALKKSKQKQTVESPHYLAFNFKKLDKVRAFKNLMKKKPFEIDVDMAQVESKENFAYVSALTRTVSFLLFLLGLFTIVIYLVNLLKTHLNSIKKNLGTYKAFGFSSNKLNGIYFKIILSKLVLALLIAFALLIILQYSGLADWVLSHFITGLDKNISCISIFNYWNLGAIIVLLFITFLLNYQTIKKILNKSPGDLIYNRS